MLSLAFSLRLTLALSLSLALALTLALSLSLALGRKPTWDLHQGKRLGAHHMQCRVPSSGPILSHWGWMLSL